MQTFTFCLKNINDMIINASIAQFEQWRYVEENIILLNRSQVQERSVFKKKKKKQINKNQENTIWLKDKFFNLVLDFIQWLKKTC